MKSIYLTILIFSIPLKASCGGAIFEDVITYYLWGIGVSFVLFLYGIVHFYQKRSKWSWFMMTPFVIVMIGALWLIGFAKE